MNNVLTRFRPGFLARSRREKFLAVLFLVVLALIWLSMFISRAKAMGLRLGSDGATARSQAQWLDGTEEIEVRYNEALTRLSGAALPSRSAVQASVTALANKYGFSPFRIDPPQTQRRDKFTFHTFSVSIDKAEYGKLEAFQKDLATSLPTVNLEQITLQSQPRTPELLDARLRLVAIEFTQ